jgi:hypothetical protein
MRRLLTLLICLTMLIPALPATAEAAEQRLVIAITSEESALNLPLEEAFFKANPGVTVEYRLYSSNQLDSLLMTNQADFDMIILGLPLIIAPKPAVSSSATQSFEKERNSNALFAREISLVTQPSFDCEQGINSQVQTACSNADAVFPVLGIVFCKNERFSLSRKTHVPLWNEPRISHVRLL